MLRSSSVASNSRFGIPDAIHAAICKRDDLTLVTLDMRLAEAARALEVDVAIPS